MPVEDINAERLATDALNVLESAETTTGFWKANPAILSIFLLAIILFGIIGAFIIFMRFGIKKALKR